LQCQTGKVSELCDADVDVSKHVAIWASVILGVSPSELFSPQLDGTRKLTEPLGTLLGRRSTPRRESCLRRLHRIIDIVSIATRDPRNHVACRRVDGVDCLPARSPPSSPAN
jgi:hypothetical protein